MQSENNSSEKIAFFAHACYNNVMFNKKLTIFALGLAVCAAAAGIYTGTARAAYAAEDALGTDDAELFLPTSYEQYLPLKAPSDVALSGGYVAVADGDTLYVYDRAAQKYASVTVDEGRTISKIGLTEGGRLFVSDTGIGNGFYE